MCKVIKLEKHGNDISGYLSYFETSIDINFELKRIYYIYQVPNKTIRGFHAHKKTKQILWCPFGKIKIIMDDGEKKSTHLLDSPEKAIIVNEGFWHNMIWMKKNSILCVGASDYYNESDYIRDYDNFIKLRERGYWEHGSKI